MKIGVLALALLLGAAGVSAEVLDRVYAVVSGTLIMQSDVTAARELGLVSSGSAPDPMREILSRLIDRALVLTEVDRYAPPEPTAETVDRELAVVVTRFRTVGDFQATLARAGLAEAHLRETLRDDLRIRAYLEQRFTVASSAADWLAGLRRRAEITDLYAQ